MSFETGFILNNRYRIVKLLGQGGFGAVYKAWDLNLSHACAVKENLDTSSEAQRQFLREATVLANLSHPNLPRVTDHFVLPGQGQYLVMDFIEGEDLQSTLDKSGPLPVDKVLVWMNQVMDALEYLHKRTPPVLHRDIKPANIKVTPEGKAVLVDFGLVKLYDSHVKTTMGARAITPGYSPPEQYGQGSTDARSDIYALGGTMYYLLTGIQPPESVQRVANDTLRPAHVVNPRVPAMIGNAIMRAMALSPDSRFSLIGQFRAALSGSTLPGLQPATVAPTSRADYGAYASTAAQAMSMPVKKKLPAWAVALIVVAGLGILGGLCAVIFTIPNLLPGSATKTPLVAAKKATNTPIPTDLPVATEIAFPTRTPVRLTSPTAGTGEGMVSLVGPYDGSISHNATDDLISVMNAGVSVSDFIVKVEFENPFSTSTAIWDYGFLFREQGFNEQYRLVIKGDNEWLVSYHTGDSDGSIVASGTLTNLDTSSGAINSVMLVAYHERGWFFLNDELVSEIDLSAIQISGNLELATGLYAGSEIDGYATNYTNFEMWQLNMSPQSGSLVHDEDGYIEEVGSDTFYQNFILMVTFANPYAASFGTFDFGFLFRSSDVNQQYRLTAAENQSWQMTANSGTADGVVVNSGTISNMDTTAGGLTSLRLSPRIHKAGSSATIRWSASWTFPKRLFLASPILPAACILAMKNPVIRPIIPISCLFHYPDTRFP